MDANVNSLAKTKKRNLITIILLCVVFAAFAVLYGMSTQFKPETQQVRLETSSYGVSEVKDLTQAEYEQMIVSERSFVLMVDNPGCVTTANMREMMSNFSDDLKFTYYRIFWQDTKNTNIRNYIKYFPSILIIDKGKVIKALQADSDDDAKYYNNAEDLKTWLETYIKFPN